MLVGRSHVGPNLGVRLAARTRPLKLLRLGNLLHPGQLPPGRIGVGMGSNDMGSGPACPKGSLFALECILLTHCVPHENEIQTDRVQTDRV